MITLSPFRVKIGLCVIVIANGSCLPYSALIVAEIGLCVVDIGLSFFLRAITWLLVIFAPPQLFIMGFNVIENVLDTQEMRYIWPDFVEGRDNAASFVGSSVCRVR